MSHSIIHFTALLAIAFACAAGKAQQATFQGTITNDGTVDFTTSNNYSTMASGIIAQQWQSQFCFSGVGGTLTLGNLASRPASISVGQKPMPTWTPSRPLECTPGNAYYVITAGAGLGDSVRRMPCTGHETVSEAIGKIYGLSQVSGTKMWIARPTPNKPDKSTMLAINWAEISQRGIDTTNYRLEPGDRLVVQEDLAWLQSNVIGKQVARVERSMGIVSLTAAMVAGVSNTPGAKEVSKYLLQGSLFDDNPELKRVVQHALRVSETQGKKASEKPGR